MNDPFGSMKGFLNMFRGFMTNPMGFLQQQGRNAPQNMQAMMQNPQQAFQQMLNNGQLTQQQYNMMEDAKNRIMQDPNFRQMFGNMMQQQHQ